jgi:hypothetical protein
VRIYFGLGLLIAAVAAAACDESLSKLAGPTPSLEPTFASIQQEVFEKTDSAGRTACVNCHTNNGGRNPSGGMNLNHDVAYDQLVRVASARKPGAVRVIPGDVENSYLIQKVEGLSTIVGSRMPLNSPPLTDGQIAILKRWIEIGAPRN